MNKSWWEGEPDALLRRCIEAGMTFTEIAKIAFGGAITRNAAIGRAYRLGIESKSTIEHRNEMTRIGQGRAARSPTKLGNSRTRIRGVDGPGTPAWAPEVGPEPVQFICDEPGEGASLLDVTGCRWPLGGWPGNGPVSFCNGPQKSGSSYCLGHYRRAVEPRRLPEVTDRFRSAARHKHQPNVINLTRGVFDEGEVSSC